LGALKKNHSQFFHAIEQQFEAQSHLTVIERGHGRLERRTVSLWQNVDELPEQAQWSGLRSIIQVKSYRHVYKNGYLLLKKPTTRYYISSLDESVAEFARRIREYWHVENKGNSSRGGKERVPPVGIIC
jgi:predicted transposase YbfD/YdcC